MITVLLLLLLLHTSFCRYMVVKLLS
jgi:hypothetical protein